MIGFALLLFALGAVLVGWIILDTHRRCYVPTHQETEQVIARARREMAAKLEAARYADMPWPLTERWLQQQVAGEIRPNSTDDFIKDLDRLINNIMWDRLAEQEGPRGIVSITNGEPRRPPVPEVLR